MDKPKRKIASRIEGMKRVHQVYQWLNDGDSTGLIISKCRELYGIKVSQVEKYLNRARKLLSKRFEKESDGQMSDILRKLDKIYRKTVEEGESRFTAEGIEYSVYDYSVARQALMDKAKILGLLTNKIDMTVNDERELLDNDTHEIESVAGYQEH